MIQKPDLESLTSEERAAWHNGYAVARIECQKILDKRDEAIKEILLVQDREMRRWRDAGITYDAVKEVLNKFHDEEISFGRLVEELRGLAAAALEKLSSQ